MDLAGIQLFELEFWHWWAIALILVVVEALVPMGIFGGMAIASAITGALFLAFPELHWKPQLAIFAALTTVFSGAWYMLLRKSSSAAYSTRQKAKEYIGRDLVLTQPLQNGFSELELDGICWELKGPNLRAGAKVRVVGVEGDILVVYPVVDGKIKASEPPPGNDEQG